MVTDTKNTLATFRLYFHTFALLHPAVFATISSAFLDGTILCTSAHINGTCLDTSLEKVLADFAT